MTTAEKLKKIAENEPKVYEAGYNIGLAKGKTDENNFFWDRYQHYGSRNSYSYAFLGTGWNDFTYNPQYKIYTEPKADRARYMFAWSGIVDTKVPIEINSGITSSGSLFVEECIFLGCKLLTTIRELYINDYNATYNRWFEGCINLTNITIKGQIKNNGFDIHWSTKLTAASLESIINTLSTTTTGLTITLPTTAQANYEAVYGAGSWSTLVATRSNWTIAYA
jgi:hypothetical protein